MAGRAVLVLLCAVQAAHCLTPHMTHSKEIVSLNGHAMETEETTTESMDTNGMITETSDWEMKLPNQHDTSGPKSPSKAETFQKEGKECTDRAFADIATGAKVCGKADDNPTAHCDDPYQYQAASFLDGNNKLQQHAGQITAAQGCCVCGGGIHAKHLNADAKHRPEKVAIDKALKATKALSERWDAVSRKHPEAKNPKKATKSATTAKARPKTTIPVPKRVKQSTKPTTTSAKKKQTATTSASKSMGLLPLWIGLGISGLVGGVGAAVYLVQGGKVFPKLWKEDVAQ